MPKIMLMMPNKESGIWEEENVRISKMKVRQFKGALKKLNEIIQLIDKDEDSRELVDYFWNMDKSKKSGDAGEKSEIEEEIFKDSIFGAFKILLDKLPDEAFQLISIISGIDEEILDEQEYDTFFDVLAAIVEVNDVNVIIERAKDLFYTTRSRWGGLKAVKG